MKMVYPPIDEEADIVVVTHNHCDHNNIKAVRGHPEIVREVGRRMVKGIPINGVKTRHGTFRTQNIVYCLEVDGIKICHLGDIGHLLNDGQLGDIGGVDILLATFSGFPVMKPEGIAKVCRQLNPKIIIPVHWRTPKCDAFFFAKRDRVYKVFEEIATNIQSLETNEMEITKDSLPQEIVIWLFPPHFS